MIFLGLRISLLLLLPGFCLSTVNLGRLSPILNTCCDLRFNSVLSTLDHCGNQNNTPENTTAVTTNAQLPLPVHLMTNNLPTTFTLTNGGLHCKHSTKTYITSYERLALAPTFEFQPDGYLKVGNRVQSQYYSQTQYCINGVNNSNLEVTTCMRTCTPQTPCIRKCCPLNSIINFEKDMCEDYSPEAIRWRPTLFKDPLDSSTEFSLELASQADPQPWYLLRSMDGWRKYCKSQSIHFNYLDPQTKIHTGTKYRVTAKGTIIYWSSYKREWEELLSENYCIDGLKMVNNASSIAQVLVSCPTQQPDERSASTYFGVLCILSSFFSLTTLVVYVILIDKQNIHGWTIMSHAMSISMFFVFLGIAHLTREFESIRKSVGCATIATLAHFFFISTFSWLTLISFDLWLTFRALSVSKSKHLKRFLIYCLFGWGIPLLIVGIGWTLEILYLGNKTSSVKVPMYGIGICYITTYATIEYAYIPCGILMTMNLTFFVVTAWKIYFYQKSTRFATQSMQKDRQSFTLFVKLFFVVGALWVIEFFNRYVFGTKVTWYIQILDTFNCLQPVAIFVIFVCKADIIKSLIDKQPRLKPILTPVLHAFQRCDGKQEKGEDSTALNMTSKMTETTMSKMSVSEEEQEDTV